MVMGSEGTAEIQTQVEWRLARGQESEDRGRSTGVWRHPWRFIKRSCRVGSRTEMNVEK
jgi:hypothetical protein